MTAIETVNINDLTAVDPGDHPVKMASTKFLRFRSEETRANTLPAIFVNAKNKLDWFRHVHTRAETAYELGIYFVDDVIVSGHSYVSSSGKLIIDSSSNSHASQKFMEGEAQPFKTFIASKKLTESPKPGLFIAGPGHLIWGHWLIDFIPRLAIAQSLLGRSLENALIPLPQDTPPWVIRMIGFFCGVESSRFLLYDRRTEVVSFKKGFFPTFAHNVALHSFTVDFYRQFTRDLAVKTTRKWFISRSDLGATSSVQRVFAEQLRFQQEAELHGFRVVAPEKYSFRDQIDLFSSAEVVVGEYGSGMHSTIFSGPGTIVGQFCLPNAYQSRIASVSGHRSAYLFPDKDYIDENGVQQLSVSRESIASFFDEVDRMV